MDNPDKNDILYTSALQLTEAATEINKKIKDQTEMVVDMKKNSLKNNKKFESNTNIFNTAIDEIENDKRNVLILVLLFILLVLVYYLKFL